MAAVCLAAETLLFDLCTVPVFGLTMMASPSPMVVAGVDFFVCAMAAVDRPITTAVPAANNAFVETDIDLSSYFGCAPRRRTASGPVRPRETSSTGQGQKYPRPGKTRRFVRLRARACLIVA